MAEASSKSKKADNEQDVHQPLLPASAVGDRPPRRMSVMAQGTKAVKKGFQGVLKMMVPMMDASTLEGQWAWRLDMYATFFVLLYVGGSISYFMLALEWDITDTIYFMAITWTTVGYGDMSFKAHRVWGGIYVIISLFGITFLTGVLLRRLGPYLQFGSPVEKLGVAELYQRIVLNVLSAVGVFFAFMLAGMFAYRYIEGETWVNAFYWSAVTLCTIGYGDEVPLTTGGKWFTTFFVLSGCLVVASVIGYLAAVPIMIQELCKANEIIHQCGQHISDQRMRSMLTDPNIISFRSKNSADMTEVEYVGRAEFCLWMLNGAGIVSKEWIEKAFDAFDAIDEDGNGQLDADDVEIAIKKRIERQRDHMIETKKGEQSVDPADPADVFIQ